MPEYVPESTIQEPSADCGQPAERWVAADRSSTEAQVSALIMGLVVGLQPALCVETGCYAGQTTYGIGKGLAENGRGRLLALDNDPNCVASARNTCHGLPVDVIQADARTYAYPDGIDFAFVDTGDPKDRLNDLDALLPHLAPHAVIAVHDTGTVHGLRPHLKGWAASHGWDLVLLPTPRGVGILVRQREGGAA